MKHEWKKHEKEIYLPKGKPELINIPSFNFITINGKGNPNEEAFSEAVGILYSIAYAIKMSPKKGIIIPGYYDYSVYPLEGIWDLSEESKNSNTFDKNEFVYKIMIRQPDFVTKELAKSMIEIVKNKKQNPLFEAVEFETIEDGLSLQILHIGSYDEEIESFILLDKFCFEQGLERIKRTHREIYISDGRKTSVEKLKTVLRYSVKEI